MATPVPDTPLHFMTSPSVSPPVTPAKAGVNVSPNLDSGLRRNDSTWGERLPDTPLHFLTCLTPAPVTPAKAGVHVNLNLDSGLRRNDGRWDRRLPDISLHLLTATTTETAGGILRQAQDEEA